MGDKSYIRTDKGYIFYDLSSRQISGLKLLSKQYGSITKHSKNIIDIIEVGDYVNGKEVYNENGKLAIELVECIPPFEHIEDIDIKSIVTKEQFENAEYKVESEDN